MQSHLDGEPGDVCVSKTHTNIEILHFSDLCHCEDGELAARAHTTRSDYPGKQQPLGGRFSLLEDNYRGFFSPIVQHNSWCVDMWNSAACGTLIDSSPCLSASATDGPFSVHHFGGFCDLGNSLFEAID